MKKQPIIFSKDFEEALNVIESGKSAFITGRAGTGKSTLLRLFRDMAQAKVVVLAPTGLAALNIQGQTIHSFFGFPPKPLTKRDIKKRRNHKLYKKIDTIIIDEVSMVRADMLDNIDYFLRINRQRDMPFGGVQMIFFGDLFQLPPVVSSQEERHLFRYTYESPYFFSAKVMEEFQVEMVELNTVYRQTDRRFVRLLDAVRSNQLDYDDIEELNERWVTTLLADDYYITLSARNAQVNELNKRKLKKLSGEEFTFLASVTGNFSSNVFPTDLALKLKVGAQVMFVKNDPKRRYVNGTIGKIVDLWHGMIRVAIQKDGRQQTVEVEKTEWEILKYRLNKKNEIESEAVGTFTQYPLRLAWAITIHKSQGKTFEKVIIDLGRGAFASGQSYVALSRCTTLEGIILKQKIRQRDILVDDRIVEFYERHF